MRRHFSDFRRRKCLRQEISRLTDRLNVIEKREGLIDYPHMDFVGVGSFIGMADKARQCFFL